MYELNWGGLTRFFGLSLVLGHLTRVVNMSILAKPCTLQPWRQQLSHGHPGTPLPVPPHATISGHAARRDYVVKAKIYDYVVGRLDMYRTKVLLYRTMVLLALLTKVRR
jgi:hypothetical protein